jgi:hypothetical protein
MFHCCSISVTTEQQPVTCEQSGQVKTLLPYVLLTCSTTCFKQTNARSALCLDTTAWHHEAVAVTRQHLQNSSSSSNAITLGHTTPK